MAGETEKDDSRRSIVWSFFNRSENKKTAKCRICNIVYQLSGSTTGMSNHIHKNHAKELEEKQKKIQEDTLFQNFSEPKKQTILDILNNNGKQEYNPEKLQIIHELIFNLVIENRLSFRFIESISFQELMKFTAPLYKIPTRQYLFGDYLDKHVQSVTDRLKDQVKDKFLSVTVDEWSQLHSNTSLLRKIHGEIQKPITESFSITVHLINSEGKRCNYIGGCVYLDDASHTAVNYARVITDKLKELNVAPDKVISCVRDGAAVMTAMTKELKIDRSVHCGNHLTQLCITDVIYDDSFVLKPLLDKLRKSINTIRRSSYLSYMVKRIQKEQQKPTRKFILDVRTRWSSLFLMVKGFLEQVDIYNMLCVKAIRVTKLSSMELEESEQLSQIVILLQPFFDANTHFSKRDSTVAHTCLVFQQLQNKVSAQLNDNKILDELIPVGQNLLTSINKRKPSSESFEALASIIDPRIAYLKVFNEDQWRNIENKVYMLLQSFEIEATLVEDENNNLDEPMAKKPRSIFSDMDEVDLGDKPNEDKKNIIKKELAVYKSFCLSKNKHPSLSADADYIFKFWSTSGLQFTYLKIFSNIVLATPASSIESERLFSLAGLFSANKLRNRLSGIKLEHLCFLVANKKHDLLKNEKILSAEEVLDVYGNYFNNRLTTEAGDEEEEESDGYLSDEY